MLSEIVERYPSHLVQGAGLIEVLVAAALLGLTGLAYTRLQNESLSAVHDAAWHHQANQIGVSATEYFLANPDGWSVYRASGNWGGVSGSRGFADCVGLRRCSAEQMAYADVARLQLRADSRLPEGRVAVLPCGRSDLSWCVVVAWGGLTPQDCLSGVPLTASGGCYRVPFYVGP